MHGYVTKYVRELLAVAILGAASVFAFSTAQSATFTPRPLDFGYVPVNTSATLPIELTMSEDFSLGQILFAFGKLPSPDPFSLEYGTCVVGQGGNCTFNVTVAPTTIDRFVIDIVIHECAVGEEIEDCTKKAVKKNQKLNDVYAQSVGAVPLPGSLPLLASGLSALGLLAYRRKRKVTH